jgi:hypothetical protein
MSRWFLALTVLGAAAHSWAASNDFRSVTFTVDNMDRYGVPRSWLVPLGVVKAAGALGILAGLRVRPIGITASASLIAFYLGAVVTVLRARMYSHLGYPTPFLLLAAATLLSQLKQQNGTTIPTADQHKINS